MKTPKRTEAVNKLVFCISIVGMTIPEVKKSAEETNAALAFCEVAVSLPPDWFAIEERIMIVNVINELFGSPHKFIEMLNAGTISYYAKASKTSGLNSTLRETLTRIHENHAKEFSS